MEGPRVKYDVRGDAPAVVVIGGSPAVVVRCDAPAVVVRGGFLKIFKVCLLHLKIGYFLHPNLKSSRFSGVID